jgi:hypothetical protein
MPADDRTPLDAVAVAVRVAQAIEAAGGQYFVGGSLASSLQGEPRATNDIDIVLELPIGPIPAVVTALGADFEIDTDMLRDALRSSSSCNIFYLPSVMKVALFGRGSSDYDEAEFARRRPVSVGSGETLIVKSSEDTVVKKLLWYRQGGGVSDRQWRDVVEVLRVSGPAMDLGYMDGWARRLGLSDLMVRARTESGIG